MITLSKKSTPSPANRADLPCLTLSYGEAKAVLLVLRGYTDKLMAQANTLMTFNTNDRGEVDLAVLGAVEALQDSVDELHDLREMILDRLEGK